MPHRRLLRRFPLLAFWVVLAAILSAHVLSVRTSLSEMLTDGTQWTVSLLLSAAAAVALWLLLTPLQRGLRLLRRDAERFAARDLGFRIPEPAAADLIPIVDSLNTLAELLEQRLATSVQLRHEEQAILGAMLEGVLAVDHENRIAQINHAAAELLGLQAESCPGRWLEEMVRHPDLHRLIAQIRASEQPAGREITLQHAAGLRTLQVRGSPIQWPDQSTRGVVVVLHDLTRMRKLESAQREFVANVSHEFKTPLTSIKGFLETLQDGAMDEPAEARRFLGIMARQVERLQALVEDILNLSRLEQEAAEHAPPMEACPIHDVLSAAVDTCQNAAGEKGIQLAINCPDDLSAVVNSALLEQAAINLLDNAIKYSESGTAVTVDACRENGQLRLTFQDKGPGIDARHIPHLFERFYRVDKARSRKAGGTGLGLAIVRQIVESHHGRVSVQSEPGKGSTFVVLLPLAPRP